MRVGEVSLFEGWLEGCGVGDFGDVGAAGLFAGFEGDAAPAFCSFGGRIGRGVFRCGGRGWG